MADPTDGFSYVSLSDSNFQVQKPYDVSVNQRYSYVGGEHRLWVYKTDKPYSSSSNTAPRTEVRITVSIVNILTSCFFSCQTIFFYQGKPHNTLEVFRCQRQL